MDHSTRRYDPSLLGLFGLEEYEHLLAPIDAYPGEPRPLSREGSELTGLPEGTPVHNGPFDLPATAMGAGVTELGDGVIIVGTTLACEVLTDRVDTGGEPGGRPCVRWSRTAGSGRCRRWSAPPPWTSP